MIAFATSITKPDVYRRCAEPGIARAAEADSEIRAMPSIGSIFASYNALLDEFSGRDDLEALVLVHQDAEIVDAGFLPDRPPCAGRPRRRPGGVRRRGRACAASPGGRRRSRCASFINRYEEHGGGDLAVVLVGVGRGPRVRPGRRGRDARRLRARAVSVGGPQPALRRVAGAVPRLRPRLLPSGPRRRAQGDDRRLPRRPPPPAGDGPRPRGSGSTPTSGWPTSGTVEMGIGTGAGTWRERALRAEADADAALVLAYMNVLETDARVRELAGAPWTRPPPASPGGSPRRCAA